MIGLRTGVGGEECHLHRGKLFLHGARRHLTYLKSALMRHPVSIIIEADQCAGSKLNHGDSAVGYGSNAGTDYWKVKFRGNIMG